MLNKLMQLGLTKNQAAVYFALVKDPKQSGGEIAKKTKIDRSFVYGILESLLDKGLVNYIVKDNARHYSATKPENLLQEIEEKKSIAEDVIGEIATLCPSESFGRNVTVYEGKAGLKVMARAILDAKCICVLGGGAGEKTLKALKYEVPHYMKEIKRKRIKIRLLISGKRKLGLFNDLFISCRCLKKQKTQASFVLFDNKVAIYSLKVPYVIMIEDGNVAHSLQAYFDLLWEIAT
jgi:sugar-specific transcriptional regulator TrmB